VALFVNGPGIYTSKCDSATHRPFYDVAVWQSLREFIPAVLKHWWFIVPGVVLGAWSLVGLFAPTAQLPPWVWLAVFDVGLLLAVFRAYHEVRVQRDDARKRADSVELPSFKLFPKVAWSVSGSAYNDEDPGVLYDLEFILETTYRDPDIRLNVSGDFEAMATGGTHGGYLFGFEWSIRDLPRGLRVELPDIPDRGIGLDASQSVPFKPVVSLIADRMTYSAIRLVFDPSGPDIILSVSYGTKGRERPAKAELILSRASVLSAIDKWEKEYPELEQVRQSSDGTQES
jgi:hypothetical protein